MAQKVWFITGASRGFGKTWAEAALGRGDQVAAAARKLADLAPLREKFGDLVLPLALDVNDRAACFAGVQRAHAHFGRLDVVVNNAGYGLFGAIEEVSEAEARAQMETNFFGALWVTQAALPLLRKQNSGHIIQVSSIGGVAAFTTTGIYHASKWALEGFSESLAQEVKEFGIRITLVEPSGFTTDWAGSSGVRARENPAYDGIRARRAEMRKSMSAGDPAATAAAILKLVDAPEPPLRLLLGESAVKISEQRYQERLKVWSAWREVSLAADGKR